MGSISGALLWTHAAYWVLAVLMVWLVRRLRVQVERFARDLEAKSATLPSGTEAR